MTATEPTVRADIPPELADHPRYKVQSQLGLGGMGVVYKAEHLMMGRTVAVKVMAQKYTANAVAVERFRREVRAAAKLAHPNIVTAYDADEAAGRHFLVMEYVEGVSLDRVVTRRGPLPVATACHVARMVALGLQHAHAKGMIHRDIKPQNVMVNRKSQVKILDFGLARLATDGDLPSSGAPAGPADGGVTATNMVVGTPDYLSPEQAMAKPDIDHRSDIYSLGCLLYFALTGRPPFAAAKTVFDKVLAQANDQPPPVTTVRRDVPDELLAVLRKMMAKNPADRYATAIDVAAELQPFTKASAASDVHLVSATPMSTAGAAEEFGFADTPPLPAGDAASRTAKHPRPGPTWKTYATLAGLIGGLLFLLLVLAAVLSPPKRDHAPPPSPSPSLRSTPAPPPTAPRVLFVLPKHGLQLDDYEPVRARLVELGDAVTTASTAPGLCGLMGLDNRARPTAEVALADVRADDFDAVLFPGTDVVDFLHDKAGETAAGLLRAMNESRKVIGAVGGGQRALLHHRLLRDRNAAVPTEAIRAQFEKPVERVTGVRWDKWRRVVTDGNIVTASGAEDAREFADAVHTSILQRRAAK